MANLTRKTIKQNGIIYSERKMFQVGNSVAISIPVECLREQGWDKVDYVILTAENDIITLVKKQAPQEGFCTC